MLVTNDDGIHAQGLATLARALEALGEVWVVAPDSERSASSHALTLRRLIQVRWLDSRWASVDGTPVDSVMLAVRKLLKERPSLVVSGINPGPNLGDDVNYSGTVGAAMEATILGIPAIAVSLARRESTRFDPSADYAVLLAREVLAEGLPKGCMLNVNVPDLPPGEIRGTKVTRLARRTYQDMIREEPVGPGSTAFWIGDGRPISEDAEDADCTAIAQGWITVTPLQLDVTDHAYLETLRGWLNAERGKGRPTGSPLLGTKD
ncbi:MAG: 5'/3'-nucleotidase SurE [Candidatus Eisenbacteria sp.]|nr:5'/3'-nucleotidase SurE [Candidatus Eisenbacteria bacterium]